MADILTTPLEITSPFYLTCRVLCKCNVTFVLIAYNTLHNTLFKPLTVKYFSNENIPLLQCDLYFVSLFLIDYIYVAFLGIAILYLPDTNIELYIRDVYIHVTT